MAPDRKGDPVERGFPCRLLRRRANVRQGTLQRLQGAYSCALIRQYCRNFDPASAGRSADHESPLAFQFLEFCAMLAE
jgi:hypothetical protein